MDGVRGLAGDDDPDVQAVCGVHLEGGRGGEEEVGGLFAAIGTAAVDDGAVAGFAIRVSKRVLAVEGVAVFEVQCDAVVWHRVDVVGSWT